MWLDGCSGNQLYEHLPASFPITMLDCWTADTLVGTDSKQTSNNLFLQCSFVSRCWKLYNVHFHIWRSKDQCKREWVLLFFLQSCKPNTNYYLQYIAAINLKGSSENQIALIWTHKGSLVVAGLGSKFGRREDVAINVSPLYHPPARYGAN